MKQIKQLGIILVISFTGELLNYLIPLPVPASIYGMVVMFLCLYFKVIKIESVKETGAFLIEIMPLMFIPAAVGLITAWKVIRPNFLAYVVITLVSTVLVMSAAGRITQSLIRHKGKEEDR